MSKTTLYWIIGGLATAGVATTVYVLATREKPKAKKAKDEPSVFPADIPQLPPPTSEERALLSLVTSALKAAKEAEEAERKPEGLLGGPCIAGVICEVGLHCVQGVCVPVGGVPSDFPEAGT